MEKKTVIREILGIFFLAAAVFIGISLLSYSPKDPSLNVARPVGTSPIHNLLGYSGAVISDLVFQLLGIAGFTLPLLFLLDAMFCFSTPSLAKIVLKNIALLLVGLSIGLLFNIFSPRLSFLGHSIPSAGVMGTFVNHAGARYVGRFGAFLIYIAIIWASLTLLINRSLLGILKPLFILPKNLFARVKNRAAIQKERSKRQKIVEKKEKKLRWEETIPEISLAPREEKKRPPKQEQFPFMEQPEGAKTFVCPPLSLLKEQPRTGVKIDEAVLKFNSKILINKLNDYGIEGKVVRVNPGPIITVYEFEPAPGIKLSRIVNLTDDLAMALSAISIRIVAPIPGKSVVGIEIPNRDREPVLLRPILEDNNFSSPKLKLPLALGKDISGAPYITDLSQMPHLLVAGSTGSGKSVALNCMILSLLFRLTPQEVRFLMIDPKMLELSLYEEIPHLIMPVVTDPKTAAKSLIWLVEEMERRYAHLADYGVRNILQYHDLLKKKKRSRKPTLDSQEGENAMDTLPYIVVVIDELADLMMTASKEVEGSITRLAQMARAVGIHLILATQRPSVDVLTGIIKANFPARISFRVASKTDSRTILDSMGAENLLGQGDMLFLPPGTSQVLRLHGAYASSEEINKIVQFLKKQSAPDYVTLEQVERAGQADKQSNLLEDGYDEKYDEAVAFVTEVGHASISMVQRRFRIGYNRAARIVEKMEEDGIVAPSDGVKPRKVLVPKIYK